jgi:hypothetical protein
MKHTFLLLALGIIALMAAPASFAQTTQKAEDVARTKTRDQLKQLLETAGPKIGVAFHQSEKQPFNMVGVLKDGLKNANSYEIVIGVTADQTIGFRVYPHYKDSYVNLDKARNGVALMRQLLRFSDKNFLFWGADQTGDVFAGYTFTLESGFPDAALRTVIQSIPNLDQYLGQMLPNIDGSPVP